MLSHDGQSSSSQRVLNILQSRSNSRSKLKNKEQDKPSNGDQPSRVKEYLQEAANGKLSDQEPIFELEIVERSKATIDQWKVIGSYLLKNQQNDQIKQSQIESLKDQQGPIVVNWDDGLAIEKEEEVKEMINRLVEKNTFQATKAGGTGCVIV